MTVLEYVVSRADIDGEVLSAEGAPMTAQEYTQEIAKYSPAEQLLLAEGRRLFIRLLCEAVTAKREDAKYGREPRIQERTEPEPGDIGSDLPPGTRTTPDS